MIIFYRFSISLAVADNSTKHILRLVEEQKRTGRISRIRKPANEAVRRPPIKPSIPYTVRAKIKELLKSYPGGLEADMFGTAYIRRFGLEINYGSLGFPSLKKFLESCSDIIDIVEQEKNGIKSISLYPKNGENAKIANGTLPVSNASRRVKVASPVKRRINATLDSQRREGIFLILILTVFEIHRILGHGIFIRNIQGRI